MSADMAAPATPEATENIPLDLQGFLASFDGDHPGSEDLNAWCLPLLEQAARLHEQDRVAPLQGIAALRFSHGQLWFEEGRAQSPQRSSAAVLAADPVARGVLVSGRHQTGDAGHFNLQVQEAEAAVSAPCFRTGYLSWEQGLNHHDPLADIYVLGLVLASCALGYDLSQADNLRAFVEAREDLRSRNPQLHPVFARVIAQMTELSRHQRLPDLHGAIRQLRDYREQDLSKLELGSVLAASHASQVNDSRRLRVQTHLRDRLFDLSRRNRLLHFRPSQQALNLTIASFPYLLNVENVKAENLLYWHPQIASKLSHEEPLTLARYIRFDDAPYLVPQLEDLRASARRDAAEYGFSPLRMVLAWLSWTNLKDGEERILSPLVLLPAALEKVKAVRDAWVLKPQSGIAEINPALRHALKKIYGIDLPETLDLATTSLASLHAQLAEVIAASEPGVQLKLVDKPRINLVKRLADLRMEQHRRRLARTGTRRARGSHAGMGYSYQRDSWQPLGIQLFDRFARPVPAPLSDLLESGPRERGLDAPTQGPDIRVDVSSPVIEREQFQHDDDAPASAYEWRFDLSQLTLANFNYRKMSLVRDYHELLKNERANPGFDLLFSEQPRPQTAAPASPALHAQTTVIAADPTQVQAVALARSQQSFIIQGPPGTGKSQTIVNLIADYLEQGKRVLFVAEKRAAIDVVFHRLGQQGLAKLCALIHDSQADKKSFVMDLKGVYEGWIADKTPANAAQLQRDSLRASVQGLMSRLEAFDAAMQQPHPLAGVPLKWLYERSLQLGQPATTLPAEDAERIPHYAGFAAGAEALRALEARLADAAAPPLPQLALRHLQAGLLEAPQPIAATRNATQNCEDALAAAHIGLRDWPMLNAATLRLAQTGELAALLTALEPLSTQGHTALLDAHTPQAQAFATAAAAVQSAQAAHTAALSKTTHWRQKPAPDDTRRLAERLSALERSPWRWFVPEFYKLKKLVDTTYDFSRHSVRPRYAEVLGDLSAEQQAAAALAAAIASLQAGFHTSDAAALTQAIERLRAQAKQSPAWLLPVLTACKAQMAAQSHGGFIATLESLLRAATALLCNAEELSLAALAERLAEVQQQCSLLPALAGPLATLNRLPPEPGGLAYAARNMALDANALERASLAKTFQQLELEQPQLRRFDAQKLRETLSALNDLTPQLRSANAACLLEVSRNRFTQHIALASGSQAGKPQPERDWARRYQAGRRELENEFGKSMRYKAIRELASNDSGLVVRDLKPVWMMSPLAISDTLPLIDSAFDVVIFDEASQIPVEDAGPSLYRAAQTIIVGDEMQLPPSQFFASGNDEEETETGDPLASDSLLSQAAKQFPATLLGWHYRSRSETLISFSNQLFYEGRLLTVPDCTRPLASAAISVQRPADALENLSAALARPVSFHAIEQGIYENRRNGKEAAYIAELLRELLLKDSALTVGVVAFSEAQQGEIESALAALASSDAAFATKLEAAWEREEDGQFCGLFVKNLENVQGDERDLIIMSVCYGFDRAQRMLMNFGPINQAGGEKRLNVVFSRARKHLFLVSSIQYSHIKNDYNPGAAALKTYLQYAEALSAGNHALAMAALKIRDNPLSKQSVQGPLADALVAALTAAGWLVERDIGTSTFRVDLAVRRHDDAHHRLGILLDSPRHYAETDLAERYWQKPSLLGAFGWQVITVLHKDWFNDSHTVLRNILALLSPNPAAAQ